MTDMVMVNQLTGEIALDEVDRLFVAAEAGQQVWDDAVAIAMQCSEDDSKAAFTVGDLALLVEKRYGENRIAEFAKTIKKDVSSVRDRRMVCKAFQKAERIAFCEANPNLLYSHLRKVVPVVRKLSLDAAYELLEKASIGDWTVEKLGVEKDKLLGKDVKPAHQAWTALSVVDAQNGRVLLSIREADAIGRFLADHKDDPDFAVEVRITYTAPKEGQS